MFLKIDVERLKFNVIFGYRINFKLVKIMWNFVFKNILIYDEGRYWFVFEKYLGNLKLK